MIPSKLPQGNKQCREDEALNTHLALGHTSMDDPAQGLNSNSCGQTRHHKARHLTAEVVAIGMPVLAVLAVTTRSVYLAQLTIGMVILAILGISWDVLSRTGLVSFGQAAFFGVGAYSTAILESRLSLPPWAAWALGLLVCGALAMLLGIVTIRLSGIYFAIATLGIVFALSAGVLLAKPITAGAAGISPTLLAGGSSRGQLVYCAIFLLGALLCSRLLLSKRIRPALFMVRGDPGLAASCGVPVVYLRVLIFGISGTLAGLAGAIYGSLYGYVVPTDVFTMNWSALAVAVAVLGGMDRAGGAVVGAILIRLLQTGAQNTLGGSAYIVAYGLLIIIVILVAPKGVVGSGRVYLDKTLRHVKKRTL